MARMRLLSRLLKLLLLFLLSASPLAGSPAPRRRWGTSVSVWTPGDLYVPGVVGEGKCMGHSTTKALVGFWSYLVYSSIPRYYACQKDYTFHQFFEIFFT